MPPIPTTPEPLGIDNIKTVLKDAIATIALSQAVFGDGFQITDLVKVPTLAADGVDLARHIPQAKAEIMDLTLDECLELLNFIVDLLKPVTGS